MADGTAGLDETERAAVKDRAREVRRSAKKGKAGDLEALEQAIAKMTGADREIAENIHRVVTAVAPELAPKTWYGFPSYARDGKVVCFWQFAAKFGTRYGHLGFNETAQLDDGVMWPTAFAITEWTPEVEERVTDLVRRAAG
jgi:uncharacterized protein YdhG (YjbR/CyaY superfamily)